MGRSRRCSRPNTPGSSLIFAANAADPSGTERRKGPSLMETKANYVVTGLFTLAVIVGAFGFLYWFQRAGDRGHETAYRVVFTGSVAGLNTGSDVTFNGIRVGQVAGLTLDPQDPRKVVALLKVKSAVPVRADTKAGLVFQGLTGLAEVSLSGGLARAEPLSGEGTEPPTIYADANASADVTQQARDVLSKIDSMVADNEIALRASLQNIQKVTNTLAQNSQRLDQVMAGLQNLTGGPMATARSARRPTRSASWLTTSTSRARRFP